VADEENPTAQIEATVDGALVILRLSGAIRLPDLQEVKRQLADRSDAVDGCSLLVDLREARLDHLSAEDLRGFAAMPVLLAAASRRAVVAPGDLGFAMARMFEILRADESRAVRVFRDFEEGRAWATQREPGPQRG